MGLIDLGGNGCPFCAFSAELFVEVRAPCPVQDVCDQEVLPELPADRYVEPCTVLSAAWADPTHTISIDRPTIH